MEEVLINFLISLNDKGLINNHDFDYEKVARAFANKAENKQLIIANVVGQSEQLKCVWCGNDESKDILAQLCNECFKKGCKAF